MAHDDGNMAGSEGTPVGLVADDRCFVRYFHHFPAEPPRLKVYAVEGSINNLTEERDSSMKKLAAAVAQALLYSAGEGNEVPTALQKGGQTPQNSFAAFQQFLRSRSFNRKQPKPYKRKVPKTAHDYFALLMAQDKRDRKAAKLAAQGFGTVAFHMPGTAEVLRNLVANGDMQVHHA